jgi:hypothetical protein
MTPQQIQEATQAICHMRGIEPEAVKPAECKLELRQRIEDAENRLALENGDYELHGVNYTTIPNITPEKKQQLSDAAKRSHFGQFTTKQ